MRSFGFFGKIPGAGDFLRHNLPRDFVDGWDRWLQTTILEVREATGSRWEVCYMSAPIWRFTLPPGMCGDAAMLGVLMPSVDRVDRQYPLTIAVPAEDDAIAQHAAASHHFAQLEAIALDMLNDGRTRASLEDALGRMAAPEAVSPGKIERAPGLMRWACPGTDVLAVPGREAVTQQITGGALWSALTDAGMRVFAIDSLPAGAIAHQLFDAEDAKDPVAAASSDPFLQDFGL